MKIWVAFVMFFALSSDAGAALEAPPVNQVLPDIRLVDDSHVVRRLREVAGQPLFLVPMYAKCRESCAQIASQLKQRLLESRLKVGDYRVLLFSFDPTDTPDDLAAFRKKQSLPLSWLIASASKEDIHTLMESIAFRYASAGGQFAHPNRIVIADADQRVIKHLSGSQPQTSALESAYEDALNGKVSSGVGTAVIFVCGIFGLTSSATYLTYLLSRRRSLRLKDLQT